MNSNIKIAPSILSADFSQMGKEIKKIEEWGGDIIHCDVMDGVFVPNITFGIKMVQDIRRHTELPLDVHLMIVEPEKYVERFVKAGADIVTIHVEAAKNARETLKKIKDLGAKCGILVSPDTAVSAIFEFLDIIDMALIMSVYPGFGGQKFIPAALDKIKNLKKKINESGRIIDIEIDGGVTEENIGDIISAGANIIVAGNTIFSAENPMKVIKSLKDA